MLIPDLGPDSDAATRSETADGSGPRSGKSCTCTRAQVGSPTGLSFFSSCWQHLPVLQYLVPHSCSPDPSFESLSQFIGLLCSDRQAGLRYLAAGSPHLVRLHCFVNLEPAYSLESAAGREVKHTRSRVFPGLGCITEYLGYPDLA